MASSPYTQYRGYEIARNRPGRFWLNKDDFRVEWGGPYRTIGAAKTAIDRHLDGEHLD